jgi:hypothetical protein
MAERAGLLKNPTWRSYPEAMLFSRALTAGMRTHCPDALGGHPAYTPEELGDVDVVLAGREFVGDVVVLLAPLTVALGAPVRAFVTGRTTPMTPSDAAPPATRIRVSRLLKLPMKAR